MGFQKRWSSPAFRRFLAIVMVVEAVTICVSFLLLNVGISSWIHQKTLTLIRISQAAAASGDWSQVPNIGKQRDSPAFEAFRKKFSALEDRYFPGNNAGTIYLVVLDHDEAYENYPDEPYPMQDIGKATKWETDAYATVKTTFNSVPYSDKSGTYLGAFTPVESDGKVVGLVAASYDTAPLTDFQGIVQTAFWLSLIPAVFLALIVAYILAGTFIEPMELFRQIEAAAENPGEGEGREPIDPLESLTPKEREVADLVRQGLKNKEIAERLFISPETVKQHLKNIREKTGFNKVALAVHAQASNLRIIKGAG